MDASTHHRAQPIAQSQPSPFLGPVVIGSATQNPTSELALRSMHVAPPSIPAITLDHSNRLHLSSDPHNSTTTQPIEQQQQVGQSLRPSYISNSYVEAADGQPHRLIRRAAPYPNTSKKPPSEDEDEDDQDRQGLVHIRPSDAYLNWLHLQVFPPKTAEDTARLSDRSRPDFGLGEGILKLVMKILGSGDGIERRYKKYGMAYHVEPVHVFMMHATSQKEAYGEFQIQTIYQLLQWRDGPHRYVRHEKVNYIADVELCKPASQHVFTNEHTKQSPYLATLLKKLKNEHALVPKGAVMADRGMIIYDTLLKTTESVSTSIFLAALFMNAAEILTQINLRLEWLRNENEILRANFETLLPYAAVDQVFTAFHDKKALKNAWEATCRERGCDLEHTADRNAACEWLCKFVRETLKTLHPWWASSFYLVLVAMIRLYEETPLCLMEIYAIIPRIVTPEDLDVGLTIALTDEMKTFGLREHHVADDLHVRMLRYRKQTGFDFRGNLAIFKDYYQKTHPIRCHKLLQLSKSEERR